MSVIDNLVVYARSLNASDVHLTVGSKCMLRIHGKLTPINQQLSDEQCEEMIFSLCQMGCGRNPNKGEDLDFAFQSSDGNRQRVNVYYQQGKSAAAIRLLNNRIPTLAELKLPPIFEALADQPRGLVLVTGPTGSGKSTTLAAMIDYINKRKAVHILTIEDPIEYVYVQDKAVIHQREVGRDASSFSGALRSALREDPDVILVGEMRDFETISAAVTAAETGHLVLSTLHTTGAAQTIDRIVDSCPPQGQQQMRAQLSTILKGVVTQALVPLASGKGRTAVTEVLVGTDAVLNLIRENKTYQLNSSMQAGSKDGMHTFDSDLARFISRGEVTREVAERYAVSVNELKHFI